MRKRSFYLSAVLFLIFGCNSKNNNSVIIQSNMENDYCWINTNSITKGMAHSGNFACRLNKDIEYGFGYTNKFENINNKLPKKVIVSFYANAINSVEEVNMVVQIDSIEGITKFWQGKLLKKYLKETNKWIEINEIFELPADILLSYKISLYFWNPGRKEVLFDDLKITFAF